jgi:hypothetical protein
MRAGRRRGADDPVLMAGVLLHIGAAMRDSNHLDGVPRYQCGYSWEHVMSGTDLKTGVTGKTIRFSWKDGPTKGTTHEHVFHQDGTVEWHDLEKGAGESKGSPAERPRFLDEEIASGIRLVSYQSRSGFTLTVALNSQNGVIAGVASNEKVWLPVHGSFEVVA